MNILIRFNLLQPSNCCMFGNRSNDRVIGRFHSRKQMTPSFLMHLMKGTVPPILGKDVVVKSVDFDRRRKILTVKARIARSDSEYIESLRKKGVRFVKKTMELYMLPRDQFLDLQIDPR